MKAEKMRELDTAELQNQARDAEEQLFRLRFQMGMGQMEGLKRYRELKKDRSRMMGVLRERELDPAKAEAAEKAAAAQKGKKRAKK
jgi:large subunit ribosomal protein L29